MSLPIYLVPFKEEIIEEMRYQNYSEEEIKDILYDFKGRKREEEFLEYLKSKRNYKIAFQYLIAKKIELKNKFDIFWGYIIDKDGQEIYDPIKYIDNKKILSDEVVEELLAMEYKNLGDILEKLKNEYKEFDLKNSKQSQFMFEIVSTVSGKLENNLKDLFCPNCYGKYVVRTYAGDLYYRLICGTREQKERERKRFENMGLHSNPWATESDFTREYWCLNCGIRWNGKNRDIIKFKI